MTTEELFQSLEFSRIREEIEKEAISAPGRELVRALTILHDRELIALQLNWVAEMVNLLSYDDSFPISEIRDSRGVIRKAAHEGSQLMLEEFSGLYRNLVAVRKIAGYLKSRTEKCPDLSKLIPRLHPFPDLENVINHAIDIDAAAIKDQASPELYRIRKELSRSADRVRKRMAAIAETHKDWLQEAVVTMREGRMVLPLKEEYRGRIAGLIHDRSATGATLFVEPLEIIEMNNRIRELSLQEKREIDRILRELTGLVRVHLFDIEENLSALAALDFIHAKARFALRLKAQKPELSGRILNILNGRHPILLMKFQDSGKVVPLNLTIGDDFHILVITGPNAGGKTVALKTVGLLSLMTQAGLLVSADEYSQFPVFDQIFVDIGDWQSVEQDLSTFTAHMNRLGEILVKATPRSLVLIDEIGTGTDPTEGAALAMAFLEMLGEIGCLTVITTHQGALKAFAYELEGAENGSMVFNEETLLPTYQFRTGIPGSSYAFE
ncbi:MAG TPA: endonuclease MutS2, partial [Bacteroidetes bacterium]|nr:endonuclease MutS2 [Bacteroidota bacterium]